MKPAVSRVIAAVFLAAVLLAPGALHAQAKRAITRIAGDLYRFQNKFHYSVFLVTPDGVIVTDPINKEAATWLKAEIAKRFNRPVKYLILSHDHRDHSSGGEVFADTATVIAHERAKAAIIGEGRPTAVPDITFSDRMTVELGGKRVELIYTGRNHTDNSIVMLFPEERTLFAVDFVSVKRLPYRKPLRFLLPRLDRLVAACRAAGLRHPGARSRGHGRQAGRRRSSPLHEDLYNAVVSARARGGAWRR